MTVGVDARASLYDFIEGACFGWHDKDDADCAKCRLSMPCSNATASKDVEDVRNVAKTKRSTLDELASRWKEDLKPRR